MKVRAAELKEQARHEKRKARFHIYGLLFFAGVFWLYHRFHSGMNEPCDKGYDHTIFTYTEKAHRSPGPFFDPFGPHQQNGTLVICQGLNETFVGKTLNFNLSTDASKIKIESRGPFVGNITIENGGSGDSVEVDLTIESLAEDEKPEGDEHAEHHGSWDLISLICSVKSEKDDSESLVLISHPEFKHHKPQHHPEHMPHEGPVDSNQPYFSNKKPKAPPKPPKPPKKPTGGPKAPPKAKIVVRVPSSDSVKTTATATIPSFEVRLEDFKFEVGDLDAAFDNVVFVGKGVSVEGVSAVDVIVVAPFGNITGDFVSSKLVDLIASHGEIDANVELWSDQSGKAAVFVGIAPAQGVKANVSLKTYPDIESDVPPSYVVKSIGGTILDFVEQPVNSTLVVVADGRVHPALVKLHPAFEGFFEVTSVFGKPTVTVPEGTKDPSGEGRSRVVKYFKNRIPWTTKGVVEWVDIESDLDDVEEEHPHRKGGVAKVTTLKAPAVLALG